MGQQGNNKAALLHQGFRQVFCRSVLCVAVLLVGSCQPTLLEPDAQASAEGFQEVWVAGVPGGGYADGKAKEARFGSFSDIAFDEAGNLYIADGANHVIRKWDIHTDQVTTLAGSAYDTETYPQGQFKDGSAEDARFFFPSSLVYHAAQNSLYVSDSANHRIRRIQANQVSTLLGHSKQNAAPGMVTESPPPRENGLLNEATSFRPYLIRMPDEHHIYLFERYSSARVIDLENQTAQDLKTKFFDPVSLVWGANHDFWLTAISPFYEVLNFSLAGDLLQEIGNNDDLLCGGFTNTCFPEKQQDGAFEKALFKNTGSLAINQAKTVLFVLDELTENNDTLRKIDLKNQQVSTLGEFGDVIDIFISPQDTFYLVKEQSLYRLEPSPAKGVI